MRNHHPLNDLGEGADHAREAQRRVALAGETQLGTHANGPAMARPGAATLTDGLASPERRVGPVAQVQRTMASAECDVANLETANRSGDFMRASWAQASVERFILQIPQLLKMAPQGASGQLTALVHTLEIRARAALDGAPKISVAAREAAQRGDYAQRNADLAPWLARVGQPSPAQSSERAPVPVLNLGSAPNSGQPAETMETHVPDDAHDIAARGTEGAGGALPHLAAIQKSSGRHDVSSVRAHVGGEAASASYALGAQAYAYGNAVAFAKLPDLHTAAHEAAHTVQQRGGVQLKGGVGAEDDAYERHADVVADRVVAGESAESLLGEMAGSGGQAAAVQRKSLHTSAGHNLAGHVVTGSSAAQHNAVTVDAPAIVVSQPGNAHGTASLELELHQIQQAGQLDAQVRAVLIPAYRHAVDALDAPAAHELAASVIAAVHEALQVQANANAAVKAGPQAAMVSTASSSMNDTPEAAQHRYDQLVASAHKLEADLANLTADLAVQLGPQIYKGTLILGKIEHPRLGKDAVQYLSNEAITLISLLEVIHRVRVIAGATGPVSTALDPAQRAQIAALVEPWHSRPVNYAFLVQALRDIGVWDNVAGAKGPSGNTLSTTANKSMEQALRMGRIADVGNYDGVEAAKILTDTPNELRWKPEAFGGKLLDHEAAAKTIYKHIFSAAPDARGPIVRELHATGRLGLLCEHLPRIEVEALHDAIQRLDPQAARMLAPYFEGKGDGESLHQRYMDAVDSRLADGHSIRAYGWFALDAIHDGLTGGFQRGYSEAYDAHEQGITTDDQFHGTAAKQLGRAVTVQAATAVTGGVAGAWGEGFAAGLGASKGAAQLTGSMIGGGASGVAGQFTSDVYDQALLDKDGFSSVKDYGIAGLAGATMGGATGGVAALGSEPKPTAGKPSVSAAKESYLSKSLKKTSQEYAKEYPKLDNLLARIRNAGVRNGLVVRVTGSVLRQLAASGLTNPGELQAAFARHATVRGNQRIDVNHRTLAKVHPQSEIETLYGVVDKSTGEVTVHNKNPTARGFVADAETFAGSTRTTDQEVREALGIDTDPIKCEDYAKYNREHNDPLFEVTFNVNTELDVALPQEAARGTSLGEMDAKYHHVAGAGKTKGKIPEGLLPRGTPIQIVEIRAVGTPRASYPSVLPAPNGPTAPFPPAVSTMRNLPAPLSSASASITTAPASHAAYHLLGDHGGDHGDGGEL